MSFRIAKDGDTVIIGIEGQLVASNRQQLKQSITDELERGSRAFVIDFAETGYIDSAGLGVLVSLSKRIREAQGELRLANLNEDLKTLFELTRLDTLFHLGEGSPGTTEAARQRPSEPDRSATAPRQGDEARP